MTRVRITGAGSEMQGVGRLSDGRAVFIPGALPGEEVEIEITRQKERFCEGRLLRVIEPSSDRCVPDCPYYGACGGCRTRHMTYAAALKLKREKVYSALTRIGGLIDPVVEDTLPSPLTDAYRNKAEFAHISGKTGVFEEGTNTVIDTGICLLQTEGANNLLKYLAPRLTGGVKYIVIRTASSGDMMLTLSLAYPEDVTQLAQGAIKAFDKLKSVYMCRLNRPHTHALDGQCTKLAGAEALTESLCGLSFSVSPRSFFQVNRLQAERLYGAALALAGLSPTDRVCDIYCGAGTISLCAAQACAHVTGIEIVPDAIRDAKQNALKNGLSEKTEFICGDAAKIYPRLAGKFDCVITDPPRKGMDAQVLNALTEAPAKRLIYVSCDPATLARDIKILTASGKYAFQKALPVDMFPQTAHVETVVLLYKKQKERVQE